MSTTNRQKFETGNPAVQGLIGRFHQRITKLIAAHQPVNLLELGCGEGFLLQVIRQRLPDLTVLGLDNNQHALHVGRQLFPDLPLHHGDIYRIDQLDHSWDMVVASEVLEHLERPANALQELCRVANRYVVLSVPWEPWFRLGSLGRGKHLKTLGNHPEHINQWTPSSFRKLVGGYARIEQMMTWGSFPWMIVLARV